MYVVLLGLVLIVYARLLPKSESANQKHNMVQEIEETIEHFAFEMDEQNRTILDLFSKTRNDYEIEMAKLSNRLELLEQQKGQLSQQLNQLQVTGLSQSMQDGVQNRDFTMHDVSEAAMHLLAQEPEILVKPDPEPKPKVLTPSLSMKNRYAELFSLYDQGKGIEAIAKKLGMNKGEVSLIIQLSKQEEKARV